MSSHDPGAPNHAFRALGGFLSPDDGRRLLFHASPVATIVVDLETRAVAVNEAFGRLFGFDAEHVTMEQLEAVTHPAFKAFTDDYHRSIVEDGASVDLDKRFVRPDGSTFWGHVTAAPMFDAEGVRWGVIGAIADVTDRIEAQAALVESEQRFRALVQNATDAIIVLDAAGRLVYASPSGERLTGNRTEDVVGADIFQYVHPDDRVVVAQSFASIFEPSTSGDGVNIPLQFRVVHNDGSVRYVEAISTNLLDDPAVNGVVVNIRDLTDSAVAESALEITEHRFRRMVEHISDTITLLDASGRVVQSTGNLRSILGYPVGFWDDRNVLELVHPDDALAIAESFAQLHRSPGSEFIAEIRVRAADSSYEDAEVYAVNLLHDPDVAAVVLTTRNISDRKRAERELNEARDQAVQALQMRTEFIASVSHELRSPIHGILGLAELLASADLDQDARHLAQSIGRATETLRMVLDDILDYSKIEVGRLEIEPRPLLVSEIAEDLLALFGPEARAKGISLVVEAERGFPQHVRVDGLRVRQVITNLVANAVKFTTTGEVRARACVLPASRGQPTRVRIEVRDTGIGIPADAHDRLFQPFSQAHASTAREFGGTGLGLSIAKRLVELMGGELGFESVPGTGSTFWFELPIEVLDAPAGADPDPEPIAAPPERSVTRVMVVEDNAVNQLLVRRQLERLGFDAVVYDTGPAAIEEFAATQADVVLMDWQLPGIDGIETTRRLRAIERDLDRPRTPIVAMTASALPGDRERCLAAGMDDFIAKPVSMVVLGEVIRRWTGDARELPIDTTPPSRAATASTISTLARSRRHPRIDGAGEGRPASAQPATAPAPPDPVRPPRAQASPAGSGAIDVQTLDRLIEDLSDPQLVASVVRTYLRELPPRVAAIDRAIQDADGEGLEAAAHVLRSTSAAVGATRLEELCRRLERGGADVDVSADTVRAESHLVRGELAEHLRSLAAGLV